MSVSESTKVEKTSLLRAPLSGGLFCLGNWRVLLVFAVIAIIAGLALKWDWLMAIGLAPVLLSTLPCLIMCAFGVCMMCRAKKAQGSSNREASDAAATQLSAPNCCQRQSEGARALQLESMESRRDIHA
jgi:hypothetical protein